MSESPTGRREDRRRAQGLRVDLRERGHRGLRGELVARNGDALLPRDRIEDQE